MAGADEEAEDRQAGFLGKGGELATAALISIYPDL